MVIPALKSKMPVVFLGAAKLSPLNLSEALTYSGKLVAADGGATHALSRGVVPDFVIGDFDSLTPGDREKISSDRMIHVAEQDTTDFEKGLILIEAPLVLAYGFDGGRMDHALAVLSALVAYPDRRCIVVGEQDVVFHAPGEISLNLSTGTRVSLFPMQPVTGQSDGLEWPIEGVQFGPASKIGTSNRATGPVGLRFDGPGMLVILPRDCLQQAVAALSS